MHRSSLRFVLASISTFGVCLGGGARAAYADAAADAQALFDQGIADMRANNFEKACPELNASLQKKPDSGTKGALAVCLTKINKVATAWQLWKDLVDTAPSPEYRADAQKKVAELEPRLPHFVVKAAKTPGLVITVEDRSVDPNVSVPLPVDPGKFKVTATAPDYKEWSMELTAEEGKTTEVVVPALVILPPDQRKKTPNGGGIVQIDSSARHSRHQLAAGIAIAGGAMLVTGLVFGKSASSKFDDVKKECGGDIDHCPGSAFQQANRDFNSAHTAATVSTVLFAVGAVVVIGGGVMWFTAPGERMSQQTAMRVTPSFDQHGGGLVLTGGF